MHYSFLPIAKRELRVAAGQKNTFRLRWWTALVAIGSSFVSLVSGPASLTASRFISSLFDLQTGCAFAFALFAGAFLTSDCLSEEKREGTLSLLFLANLKGADVVVGKFAGLWLSAIYVLLALLPVTAIPLLLGGVGFGEFWRMVLALMNTLFFSLAVGMAVSAFVTHYVRSLTGTLSLLIGFGILLPALAGGSAAAAGLAWLSPFYPCWCARDAHYAADPAKYWGTLMGSNVLAWIALALATYGVRRSWKDCDRAPQPAVMEVWLPGGPVRRPVREGPFDPVLWLAGDAPFLRGAVWLIVVAWGVLVCTNRFWLGQGLPSTYAARICGFLLKALFAFQACRFFVETRRSGAIELLLCAPLRNADLIKAQWRVMLRLFLWPLVLFVVFAWLAAALPERPRGSFLVPAPPPGALPDIRTGFLGNFLLTMGVAADVLAVGWFGMWLALTMRRPALAPALTIVAVLVLPTLLSPFDLVADMLFISWGTTRFQEEFRWVVAGRMGERGR